MPWKPRQQALSRRLGRYGVEYRYRCPQCHQDNLWWVPGRGGGKCWNCAAESDEKGNLTVAKMQRMFRDFSETDELAQLVEEINATTKTTRPARPVPTKPAEEEPEFHWKARWYLERERKVPSDVARAAGVWYNEQSDRLYFPLTQILGGGGDSVVPCMSRTPDPSVKDWRVEPRSAAKEQYWFNPTGIDSGTVVFVEGPFDVLASGLLHQAIALCGTAFTEPAEDWVLNHKKVLSGIWLWLDADLAGRNSTAKIAKKLGRLVGSGRVKSILYDKEPGDCSPDEAAALLKAVAGHTGPIFQATSEEIVRRNG